MSKFLAIFAMVVLLLGTSSCFRHTYTMGKGGTDVKYAKWSHQFLGGLVNGDSMPVNINKICGSSDDITIHDEQTFLNSFVRVLTINIYTPSKISVRCGN